MENEVFFERPRNNRSCYRSFILTIPALSYSLWCIAATTYTALIYEHVRNILKNVTIHIEI